MAPDRTHVRARLGIAATFALAGALCAVWTTRVPALKDKLDVGEGPLGLIVLAFGIGGILSMSAMGPLVARFGSRALLRVAVPLCAVAAGTIGLAPDLPSALAGGFFFGVAFGVTEVAMNTQASRLEHLYGRPLMTGMHAGWSLGAVAGGIAGAITARAGLGFTESVAGAAVVGLPIAWALRSTYLPDAPAAPRNEAGTTGAPRTARRRVPVMVYVVGLIAFSAFVIEGAVADWSGLYLRDTLGSTEALAALAYPMFEGAMAIGRLTGDRVTGRFGARGVIALSGLFTAAGLAFVLVARGTVLGLAGFFLVGAGVCLVVPLSFSVAGALGGADGAGAAGAGQAIARVGTIAYGGLLLGPVVIGFVAEASTLRTALVITVGCALVVAAAARVLPRTRHLGPVVTENGGPAAAEEPVAAAH